AATPAAAAANAVAENVRVTRSVLVAAALALAGWAPDLTSTVPPLHRAHTALAAAFAAASDKNGLFAISGPRALRGPRAPPGPRGRYLDLARAALWVHVDHDGLAAEPLSGHRRHPLRAALPEVVDLAAAVPEPGDRLHDRPARRVAVAMP